MNPQLGTNHSYHDTTNRNGEHLSYFYEENELLCLNTHYPKRLSKLFSFTYPNGTKAQLDYIMINKKWKNSATNCEAYSSFAGVFSDHKIVTAEVRLSLRANKKKSNKSIPYDWSTLINDKDIQKQYNIKVQNRFELLQNEDSEPKTPSNTYNNFVKAHEEAAKECIPLKPNVKRRKPWESKAICEKREKLKEITNIKEEKQVTPSNLNKQKFLKCPQRPN